MEKGLGLISSSAPSVVFFNRKRRRANRCVQEVDLLLVPCRHPGQISGLPFLGKKNEKEARGVSEKWGKGAQEGQEEGESSL